MQPPFPTSIESKARMTPSVVDAPIVRSSARIVCGCCNQPRERGHFAHPILGELCSACSFAFDPQLPRRGGLPLRDSDACPFCALGDCDLHD